MRSLRFFVISFLFIACNSPQAVFDHDEQTDFRSYSSIAIYPDIQTGLSELDEKRLLASVQGMLQERNLYADQQPDLYLNVYSEAFQEQSRNSLGVGVGGTGRNVGVGISGGIPLGGPTTFIRLTFDLVEAQTNNLVWQAVVDSKFDFDASPEDRQMRFDKIVRKALEGYPPEK